MLFWKVDEETIHCLINKDEISSLGYDLDSISKDADKLESFLETIVENSREYIDWSTENGIQNYMARALPADHFLITISCTFQDEIIDRNVSQIRKMTESLIANITEDRLGEIESLTGEDKERAFSDLARDLYAICNGIEEERPEGEDEELYGHGQTMTADDPGDMLAAMNSQDPEEIKKTWNEEGSLPDRKLVFASLDEIITFAGILKKDMLYTSTLYKSGESYVLLVRFDRCKKDSDAVHFILAAEEYGGRCSPVHYDEAYMLEHGKVLIRDNALTSLALMAKH